MATVALIGADGAGKTTVARRIEASGRLPVKYLYLGVNAEASNCLLPTTRLLRWVKRRRGGAGEDHGPPPAVSQIVHKGGEHQQRGRSRWLRRLPAAIFTGAKLTNRIAEEWYRQGVARWHQHRGRVVVFDRHYLADYSAHDMDRTANLPVSRRVHGWLLRRYYPQPDLVVFLDAPPEVLLARKGEGTLADLQRRREDYRTLASSVPAFVTIDAAQPVDRVVDAVEAELTSLLATNGRRGQ